MLASVLSQESLERFPGIGNLRIIASGLPETDAVDALESEAWAGLVSEWREDFDVIVFDSSPVLLFTDPVLVARHVDGMVLVYHVGKVSREVLKRAKEQVVERNARLIGVVMNDMKIGEMSPHYGFYYDYGHYQRGKDKNRIPSA